MTSATSSQADSSSPSLASYYDRHMALQGDVAYGWIGRGQPARMMAGVVQVGVSDKGKLVEIGTHDALVTKGGVYAKLAALQFGASG